MQADHAKHQHQHLLHLNALLQLADHATYVSQNPSAPGIDTLLFCARNLAAAVIKVRVETDLDRHASFPLFINVLKALLFTSLPLSHKCKAEHNTFETPRC